MYALYKGEDVPAEALKRVPNYTNTMLKRVPNYTNTTLKRAKASRG